jgi:MFS family permease
MQQTSARLETRTDWLNRNVVAISASSFLMSFGEELWKRFIPRYLQALGAPIVAVGAYGSVKDLVDGLYQYPGGWISDRYGRRTSLLLFLFLAAVGYALYLVAPNWPYVIAGVLFVMAWSAMANPTLFAVIGDSLPRGHRAAGFTLQSLLRRVPIIFAANVGGIAIATYGVRNGVRLCLALTLILALITALVVSRIRLPRLRNEVQPSTGGRILLQPALRRLLASDILIRLCEGLSDVLMVIYATTIIGVTAAQYGMLVAVQMAVSIAAYFPAVRLADRIGRKPFVIATFIFFAAFPLAVIASSDFSSLLIAFTVGGLREIGEPARKAMIVDFSLPEFRGRTVGLYYLVRSLSISPAAYIGGLLWTLQPRIPFLLAGVVGFVGTFVFAFTVDEKHAA